MSFEQRFYHLCVLRLTSKSQREEALALTELLLPPSEKVVDASSSGDKL